METIVVREPGAQMPEAFRKVLLEKHPTAFGYAVPMKDTHIDNEPFPGDEVDLEDSLKQVEETYAKERVFYHFVNAELGPFGFESLQPFNLLTEGEGDNEITLLSVMLEGEFPKYDNMNAEGEMFTSSYHFMNSFLQPLIAELWELCNSDVGMLMAFLDKKTQKDKILAEFGPRASVLIIPHKGKATAIVKNEEGGSWKWGFSTRNLGYKEKEEKAPAEALKTTRKMTMREAAALAQHKKEAEAESENEGKEAKEGLPPGGTPVKPEELYASLLKTNSWKLVNGGLWAIPPKGSDWKTARSWWHRSSSLDIPVNDKGEPDVAKVYLGFPADKLKPNSPLNELLLKVLGLDKPKEAESEQGPAKPEDEEKKEKGEFKLTLLIPHNQKSRFVEFRKKDAFPSTTLDVLMVGKEEYPAASVQLGENLGDILMMAPESYARIVHDVGSHVGICLLHEMRIRILELEAAASVAPKTATVVGKPKMTMREAALKKTG